MWKKVQLIWHILFSGKSVQVIDNRTSSKNNSESLEQVQDLKEMKSRLESMIKIAELKKKIEDGIIGPEDITKALPFLKQELERITEDEDSSKKFTSDFNGKTPEQVMEEMGKMSIVSQSLSVEAHGYFEDGEYVLECPKMSISLRSPSKTQVQNLFNKEVKRKLSEWDQEGILKEKIAELGLNK